MAELGVLAPENEDRERLATLLGELGHLAHGAGALEQALELARERRARAFLVVDGGPSDAETTTRELLRAFPLLPVVVALKRRDAQRAVALMRVGAAEVVAPPWTKEDLKASVSKGLRFQGTALTPLADVPGRRHAYWYALGVGLFLAAALGAASLRRMELNRKAELARVDHWDLPVRHPAGLAYDGKQLWIVEWFTQSLYGWDRADARIGAVRHFPAETPVSAAFTAESVWTVTADGTVERRMRDDRFTTLTRWERAAPSSAGLAFDGLYLWTLNARKKTLEKHLLDAELTVAQSFPWRGAKAAGLTYDGKLLWTLDAADRRLLGHSLERPDEPVASVPLPEYGSGLYEPRGLAWDGKRFWTVGEAADGKGTALLVREAEER